MKKLPIKRWMLGASAMIIMANTAGCSLQKDKCQEEHLYMSTIEEIKNKNNGRPYLERDTMIPMEEGDVCVEEVDLKNAIRENFYIKHSLLSEEWKKENSDYIEFNEYNVFAEFEKGIEQKGKIICDDTLCQIEEDKTTIDFIQYIVSLEEKKQGRYLSDKQIAEMFTVNGTYYAIESEKEDESYTFEIQIDSKEHKNDPYRKGSYECVRQKVESDNLEIEKTESITISPREITTNIRTYQVGQSYELTFPGKNKEENVRLFLNNNWEIQNSDIMPNETYHCRNYDGSFSIEYNGEKIKTEVTEEEYEELAEMISQAVQNKNTTAEFLETNNKEIMKCFEEKDTNIAIENNSLVLKKK